MIEFCRRRDLPPLRPHRRSGTPIRYHPRAIKTQIYVGVLGVRQQTGYLGVLACSGESIGRWHETKKWFPQMPEVIILAKPWILEVSDTNYNIKEKFAYIKIWCKRFLIFCFSFEKNGFSWKNLDFGLKSKLIRGRKSMGNAWFSLKFQLFELKKWEGMHKTKW